MGIYAKRKITTKQKITRHCFSPGSIFNTNIYKCMKELQNSVGKMEFKYNAHFPWT